MRRPAAVDEDGVGGVDGFVAVMEGDGRGPHFREHVVAREDGFAVHGAEEAAGEAGGGADCGATGGEGSGGVVAGDVGDVEPCCAVGVEEGAEGYEVCFFADAPGVFVFFVGGGRDGVVVVGSEHVFGAFGTPDGLVAFALWGAGDVCSGAGFQSRPNVVGVVCSHLRLHTDHLFEIFPGAVHGREIESTVALPEALARLTFGPLSDSVEEVIPLACVPYIHLPIPYVLVLGVLM